MEDEREHADMQPSQGILDPAALGRRLRAGRILQSFDSAGQLSSEILRQTGVVLPERQLWKIERGEALPTLEQAFAIVLTLEPHNGIHYLAGALRSDLASRWEALHHIQLGQP